MPDAGFALRYRSRRRQMGWSARADHRDFLRGRSAPKRGRRLPFAIEVTGFADEEGVRFASTLLGSRAVAGTFNESVLGAKDEDGISMREAMIAVRARPRSYRRGGQSASRIAGLCRTAYRAGTGAGSRASAGRSRHRHRGRDAACGKPDRHGRPCRHGADGAAPRRADGRRANASSRSRNCAGPTWAGWSARSDTSMPCQAPPT